jgi:Zn-dependent protease with chaperone function
MQIVVILGFALTLSLLQVSAEQAFGLPGFWFAPAICLYMLGMVGLKWWDTLLTVRSAEHRVPAPGKQIWRLRVVSALVHAWLLAGPPVLMLLGLGRWINEDLGLLQIPLAAEVAALVPFLAALSVYWILEYPSHLVLRHRACVLAGEVPAGQAQWTLGQYVLFQVRTQLLFIAAPVALILFLSDCIELYISPLLDGWAYQDLALAGMVTASAGGVFLIAPALLTRVWKTSILPDGPVRRELEQMCRRLQIRYRKLLIWQSGGVLVNAGVMGLVAPIRYILLSDGMLRNMHPEQVKAIFVHEAEHIRRHHIFYAILFAISTILLGNALASVLELGFGWPALASISLVLGLMLVVWGFGFGWLSRRFERQCDTAAAWSCGPDPEDRPDPTEITPEGAAVFAGALDQVARLNRMSRNKFNWRHGSISWRVAYILHLGAARGSRCEIDRLVRRIQRSLWLLLAISVFVSWWVFAWLGWTSGI